MPRASPSNSISNKTSPRLDAVPEDQDIPVAAWKLPASYRKLSQKRGKPSDGRRTSTSPTKMDKRNKGKEKDMGDRLSPPISPRLSGQSSPPRRSERHRGQWVVDLESMTSARENWGSKPRIILIMGAPTAETLSPLLYSPAFADTLLLIGTVDPIPSIEALVARFNNAAPEGIIPTIFTFSLPPNAPENKHPFSALFETAHGIAKAHRTTSHAKWMAGKRTTSYGSMSSVPRSPTGTETPGSTLPRPSRPASMVKSLSNIPGFGTAGDTTPSMKSRTASTQDLPRIPSESSMSRQSAHSSPGRSRLSMGPLSFSNNRNSTAPSSPSKSSSGLNAGSYDYGSPFDAVLNFIPPSATYAPNRAMQDMLQQSIIVTTGSFPLLMLRARSPEADLDIPILHVVPSPVPGPLAHLIENFLIDFGESFKGRLKRNISPMVVTLPVWLEGGAVGPEVAEPGAEILLFGGVRSKQVAEGMTPRAYLSKWSSCSMASANGSSGSTILMTPKASGRGSTPLVSPALSSPPTSVQDHGVVLPLAPPTIYLSYEDEAPLSPHPQPMSPKSPTSNSPTTPRASRQTQQSHPQSPQQSRGYTSSQIDSVKVGPVTAQNNSNHVNSLERMVRDRDQPPTPELEHTSSCSSTTDSAPQSTGTTIPENENEHDHADQVTVQGFADGAESHPRDGPEGNVNAGSCLGNDQSGVKATLRGVSFSLKRFMKVRK